MNYDFYGFNPWDFESLVQAIFQKLLGDSSLVYGLGADGGRELSFQGRASFASPHEIHDGLWIVQAKFRSRDVHDHDQYQWVKTNFTAEMRKFKSGKYPVPNQYIFVTNAVLTPGYLRGGRDKMEELITHYRSIVPRIYIIAYDELCKLLLNNADVRQAYDHLLHPGDQLAQIRRMLYQHGVNGSFVVAEKEIREVPTRQNYSISLPPNPILTIDFGTSYSLCGLITQRGQVELAPTTSGGHLLSSIISFFNNGNYIVGNNTLRNVKSSEILTFAHIKRYLNSGRRFDVYGTFYTAEQLATLIIKSLKISAEEFFGYFFKGVVVAKPANFNLKQTRALRQVFEDAGLTVIRMLDEGTAPCYLFPKVASSVAKESLLFLVIDLGGGTFDLSLQEFSDGVYETKAVLGDNQLGGIDFDKSILDLALKKLRSLYPELVDMDANSYLAEAERIKKVLSVAEFATFIVADYDLGDGNMADFSVSISRAEFKACTSSLNVKIMRCLHNLVGANAQNLDAIMLTGQGAKIFTVREVIEELFSGIRVIDQFMENAVCLGNGYQSGVIQGIIKDELLLSVQNTGLAINAKGDIREDKINKKFLVDMAHLPQLNTVICHLIMANTTIPARYDLILNVTINDPAQLEFTLPILEVTEKNSKYDEITDLQISVCKGLNEINLTVEIDANHQINLKIYNEANDFRTVCRLG